MLTTRLWMGSLLAALTGAMLFLDNYLAPVFPFLWLFQTLVILIGCVELILLLGPGRRPQVFVSIAGVLILTGSNWFAHAPSPWSGILGCFVGLVLAMFIWEMVLFQEEGRCVERMGLTLLILVYLGLLPCFFAQIRWLFKAPEQGSFALALAIFVPKCCDIGAFIVGRLLGRHSMTPVLSPKKTWEGAVGGLILATLAAIALDRWSEPGVLHHSLVIEIAFGISVGGAGMLGDLAESLMKRDCRSKDASQVVPGFGGVLDVLDSVIFAAPLVYLWMHWTSGV